MNLTTLICCWFLRKFANLHLFTKGHFKLYQRLLDLRRAERGISLINIYTTQRKLRATFSGKKAETRKRKEVPRPQGRSRIYEPGYNLPLLVSPQSSVCDYNNFPFFCVKRKREINFHGNQWRWCLLRMSGCYLSRIVSWSFVKLWIEKQLRSEVAWGCALFLLLHGNRFQDIFVTISQTRQFLCSSLLMLSDAVRQSPWPRFFIHTIFWLLCGTAWVFKISISKIHQHW